MRRIVLAMAAISILALAGTALAAGTLTGSYKTKVSGTKSFGGFLNATWVLKLTKGHYAVTRNGKLQVRGKDTIKGHVITVRDTSGPAKCSGTGKFRYTLKGKKLRFKKISDPSKACAGRDVVLSHVFTKVS